MSRAQKIKTQPPTTTTTLPLEEYILDESIPEYMDDIQLSCACVNHSGHITQCAYLNLRVPALSGDVRFTVCVCGDCVSDEPSYDGGPFLKEICINCSMEYLENLSKNARLSGERLEARVTVDNYLQLRDENVALGAMEEWVKTFKD